MKKSLFILAICLGLCGALPAQNVWKPIDIPGDLLGVTSDGSIFAYFDNFFRGEIARSQDEGETWQVVLSSETDPDLSFIAYEKSLFSISDEGRIFVLVKNNYEGFYIFYSDDNGDTWQQTTEIEISTVNFDVIGGLTAPTNDIIVVWSSQGQYAWTVDGGVNWNYTFHAPPHVDTYQILDVIVNASGVLYVSYCDHSDAAIARTNIFDLILHGAALYVWCGVALYDSFEIPDMEFDPDGNVLMGAVGDMSEYQNYIHNYCQDEEYYVFKGQTIAVSDNGVVYRLRNNTNGSHAILGYSLDHGEHFLDVGEPLAVSSDGSIYKGRDNQLYFYGSGQYWKSIPDADAIPSMNPWYHERFFDETSGLYYMITDNNTAEVTYGETQYQGEYVIPETVSYLGDTYTVIGIGYRSFFMSGATHVDIPATIMYIGEAAFFECFSLDSIHIPNSVISIGERAFEECSYLKTIHLSESLETIESRSFYDCCKLQSVTLPESLLEIKDEAFEDCHELDEIIIPKNVEYIGVHAFGSCYDLGRIELGKSVVFIGEEAFFQYYPHNNLTLVCHNPVPAQCGWHAFPSATYQETAIVPCGCEEAYRSAWNTCWSSGHFEEDCSFSSDEWYYEILNDDGSITYQYLYQSNDTVIDDETVHIIVKINTLYDKELYDEVTHEYIFERDGKVYWWNKTLEEFTVLYDFGAEAGDEWEIKVGAESLVMHVDAVEQYDYEGEVYKMLHVSDADDLFSGDIVCGIGHLTSFFPERLMSKGYRVEGIRCFWKEGDLVFQYGDSDCDEIYEGYHTDVDAMEVSDGFQIYPNPTDGKITISGKQTGEYSITNIMGQTLMTGRIESKNQQIDVSSLSDGIYFIDVNGKTMKFVKK